jgi:hypothetical protein
MVAACKQFKMANTLDRRSVIDTPKAFMVMLPILTVVAAVAASGCSGGGPELFEQRQCKDFGQFEEPRFIAHFIADRQNGTVLMEQWLNAKSSSLVSTKPWTNCTIQDQEHWVCSEEANYWGAEGPASQSRLTRSASTVIHEGTTHSRQTLDLIKTFTNCYSVQ